MKTFTFASAFMFLTLFFNAQESKPRLEFGSTLLTVNSLQSSGMYPQSKPSLEYLNGIYLRYQMNRWSIRFLSSYSDNSYTYSSPPEVVDGTSGDGANKDFRIGVGAQCNLLRTKEWLYAFTDVLYRNVYTSGNTYGGIGGGADSFTSVANGIDSFYGIGFKFKVYKSLYISPELAVNVSMSSVNEKNTPMGQGQVSTAHSYDLQMNNVLKLHVGVKF